MKGLTDLEELNKRFKDACLDRTKVARTLNINPKTLTCKMNGLNDFAPIEIWKLSELLHLSHEELVSIFFANAVVENTTNQQSGKTAS